MNPIKRIDGIYHPQFQRPLYCERFANYFSNAADLEHLVSTSFKDTQSTNEQMVSWEPTEQDIDLLLSKMGKPLPSGSKSKYSAVTWLP